MESIVDTRAAWDLGGGRKTLSSVAAINFPKADAEMVIHNEVGGKPGKCVVLVDSLRWYSMIIVGLSAYFQRTKHQVISNVFSNGDVSNTGARRTRDSLSTEPKSKSVYDERTHKVYLLSKSADKNIYNYRTRCHPGGRGRRRFVQDQGSIICARNDSGVSCSSDRYLAGRARNRNLSSTIAGVFRNL